MYLNFKTKLWHLRVSFLTQSRSIYHSPPQTNCICISEIVESCDTLASRLDSRTCPPVYECSFCDFKCENLCTGRTHHYRNHYISRYVYNEHSFKHRPSCFKKGVECRFNYPAAINTDWSCDLGLPDNSNIIDDSSTSWALLNGIKRCHSFSILPKRNICDLYLNVHNQSVVHFNGFNNNVQLGDPAHIFYKYT